MGATLEWLFQFFPATITRVIERDGQVTAIYIRQDDVLNKKTGGTLGSTDYEFAPQLDFNEELFEIDGEGRYLASYGEVFVGERHYFALESLENGAGKPPESE